MKSFFTETILKRGKTYFEQIIFQEYFLGKNEEQTNFEMKTNQILSLI